MAFFLNLDLKSLLVCLGTLFAEWGCIAPLCCELVVEYSSRCPNLRKATGMIPIWQQFMPAFHNSWMAASESPAEVAMLVKEGRLCAWLKNSQHRWGRSNRKVVLPTHKQDGWASQYRWPWLHCVAGKKDCFKTLAFDDPQIKSKMIEWVLSAQ